jgi:hypothetical protein
MLAITLVSVTLQAHAFGLGLSGGVGNIFGELATRSGTQASGDSIDEVLQQLSLELNKKMPISVDAVTRLDRVSAEPGRLFTYHYTVVPASDASTMRVDFSREIKPQLKSQMCSNPDTQKFLKNGVTVVYEYQDASGHELGDARFTPSDCGYKS